MKKTKINIETSIIIKGDSHKALNIIRKLKKEFKKLDYKHYAAFNFNLEDFSDGSGN